MLIELYIIDDFMTFEILHFDHIKKGLICKKKIPKIKPKKLSPPPSKFPADNNTLQGAASLTTLIKKMI